MDDVYQDPSGFSAHLSNLLGCVVGGLHWLVVGVEAPGQANKNSRFFVVRVPQNTLPNLAAGVKPQAVWRSRTA